jgi:hypothetical protein
MIISSLAISNGDGRCPWGWAQNSVGRAGAEALRKFCGNFKRRASIDRFGRFSDSVWRAPTIMSGRVTAMSIIGNGKWSAAYESDVASANLYLGFFYHFPC